MPLKLDANMFGRARIPTLCCGDSPNGPALLMSRIAISTYARWRPGSLRIKYLYKTSASEANFLNQSPAVFLSIIYSSLSLA